MDKMFIFTASKSVMKFSEAETIAEAFAAPPDPLLPAEWELEARLC